MDNVQIIEADNDDIGKLVQYYDDGWRVGTLEELTKKVATIRPYNRLTINTPRCVKIEIVERTKDGNIFVNVRKLTVEAIQVADGVTENTPTLKVGDVGLTPAERP